MNGSHPSRVVWLEALTPKQARLASSLAHFLKEKGYNHVITAREYDYTSDILKISGCRYVSIGAYGGAGKLSKLRASVARQSMLATLIGECEEVTALVSFPSPDATRVAFGLGLPIILLNDSPHSVYVNRLTLTLADAVIVPECTRKAFEKQVPSFVKISSFEGLFEVAWIRDFKPSPSVLEGFGLDPFSYAIVRPQESKAAYYPREKYNSIFRELIRQLSQKVTVLYYPRYPEQRMLAREVRKGGKVKLLSKPTLLIQDLEYFACLVVTGGATMAQEAALLGTPSITYFPKVLETVEFLKTKGLPIFHVKPEDLVEAALAILRDPDSYRVDPRGIRRELEDPRPLVEEELESLRH